MLFASYIATLGAMRVSWASRERHGWREYMMIVFAHGVEGALMWWIARSRANWKALTLRDRASLLVFTSFNFAFFTFSPMYSPVRLVVAQADTGKRKQRSGAAATGKRTGTGKPLSRG